MATAPPSVSPAAPPQRLSPPAGDDLRAHLRTIVVAWMFGSFWLTAVTGAALARFQLGIGARDEHFGWFAAIPYAAMLLQLPASLLQTRLGRRKPIFMVAALFGRLMWMVTAAIPWLLPGRPDLWPQIMLLTLFLSYAGDQAGSPAWMDWMADVIPNRLRGRFFGHRKRMGQLVSLAATVGVGLVLLWAERTESETLVLQVAAAALAIGGLMGALDILAFVRIPDDYHPAPQRSESALATLLEPLKDRHFRYYLAFNFTFNAAIGFIGQYIWLYMFKVIHFSSLQANLMLVAIPGLLFAATYSPWGRVVDRLGKKPVLLITGAVVINGAWGWILVGHAGPDAAGIDLSWLTNLGISSAQHWHADWLSVVGYAVALIAMLCWPGMEIANFNILLGLTGSRAGKRSGTAYVALYGVAVAAGGVLSGVIGSTVAASLGDLHWLIPGLGVPLTYHGVLFLLSATLRALSLGFAAKIEEPKAIAPRAALRFLTSNFYSNVRDAAALPLRVIDRVYHFTYRLVPRRPPRR